MTDFEDVRLKLEIERVFENRATHSIPSAIPEPPPNWGVSYRELAEKVGIDPNVTEGFRLASAFLGPLLATEPSGRCWDPVQMVWHLER
jgi:hypothetical protein